MTIKRGNEGGGGRGGERGGEGRSHRVSWGVLPSPAGLQPSPCAAGAPAAALTHAVCAMGPLVVDALSPAGASFWKEAGRRSCTCTIFSRLSARTPLSPKCMVTSGWPGPVGAWTLALGFHTHHMGIMSLLSIWPRERKLTLEVQGQAGLHAVSSRGPESSLLGFGPALAWALFWVS